MTTDRHIPPDDNSVSLAAAHRIDAICDAFEAEWRTGGRPPIVASFDPHGPEAAALLRELLRIEIEYRAKAGDTPSRQEYLSRFPQFASVVVEVVPADPAATSVGQLTRWSDSTNNSLSDLAVSDTSVTSAGTPSESAGSYPKAPTIGSHFGPYELIAELGHGGMGVVYRARHRELNRFVALKIINPARVAFDRTGQGAKAVARFRFEAEAAARFEHANIVQIFDVGTIEGLHYYAMRFVAGASLAQLVEKGSLAPRRAARYIAAAARAAEEIHAAGFLHRDLKPGNILIEEDTDTPFVADFGLAKFIEASQGDTLTGDVFGTPPYMSPEQLVDSSRATTSSDIYSLGATLYHLLAGQPPFQAETAIETARQALECAVRPPRRLNPTIDRELEAICLKALEKSPKDRYLTVGALAGDLEAWLDKRPIKARPATPGRRLLKLVRRRPRAVLTAVACISVLSIVCTIVTVSVVRANRSERAALQENRLQRSKELVEQGNRLLESGDTLSALPLLTAALAMDRDDTARSSVHRNRVAMTAAAGPKLESIHFCDAGVAATAVDPSGTYALLADSRGKLSVLQHSRSEPLHKITLGGPIHSLGFASNGAMFFAVLEAGPIHLYDSRSGEQLTVLSGQATVRSAALDPSRTKLVTGHADGLVVVREWTTTHAKRTFKHDNSVKTVAFSPDGKRLATASLDGFARLWDLDTGELAFPPFDCEGAANAVACSPSGRVLAAGGVDGKFRLWQVDDRNPEHVATLEHGGVVQQLLFNPKGDRILSVGEHGVANLWSVEEGRLVAALTHERPVTIAAFDHEGGMLITGSQDWTARIWDQNTGRPLSAALWHAGPVASVGFGPKSDQILTASTDGGARLWNVADLCRQLQLGHRAPVTVVSAAPEHGFFATASHDLTVRTFRMDLSGPFRDPLKLSGSAACVAISPDGAWLATGSVDRTARLWRLNNPPTEAAILSHAGPVACVSFSPDKRWLATASHDAHVRLWEMPARQLEADLLHSGPVRFVGFSADGRSLLSLCHNLVSVARLDGDQWAPLPSCTHSDFVHSATLSADGSYALTACADGAARVWDVERGEVVSTMNHAGAVLSASFMPSEESLVTRSADATVRIWDWVHSTEVAQILQHDIADSVKCSPDGRLVVVATPQFVEICDTATGEIVGPRRPVSSAVLETFFDGPGETAVVVCEDGKVLSIDLTADDRPIKKLEAWAQVISCRRFDPVLGLVPLMPSELRRAAHLAGLTTGSTD